MRMLGMGSKVDELKVGMNPAAEKATPQAKQIFLAALEEDDLRRCPAHPHRQRHSRNRLLQATSSPDLTTAFGPIVHTSMQRVGVVQQYD